jgi:hypothetical protein
MEEIFEIDSNILECYAMLTGKWSQMFREKYRDLICK